MPLSTIGANQIASNAVTNAKLASGAVTAGDLPSGTVLQVQRTSTTTTTMTTTYQDVGLSIDITPSSTNSKILLMGNFIGSVSTGVGIALRFLRGATDIYNPNAIDGSGPYYYYSSGNSGYMNASIDYLDSPSSTSQVTYKVQARLYFNTSAGFGISGNQSATNSFVAMEIAG